MADLIPVNILIGDRSYRLKVDRKDEERLRKTVKFINDKIFEYKGSFAGKDMQDYISMALLWFATEQSDNAMGKMAEQEAIEKITAMEGLIEKTLAGK